METPGTPFNHSAPLVFIREPLKNSRAKRDGAAQSLLQEVAKVAEAGKIQILCGLCELL